MNMEKINGGVNLEKTSVGCVSSVLIGVIIRLVFIVVALILTISSLAVFADRDRKNSFCMLFIDADNTNGIRSTCQFITAGQVIVMMLLLVAVVMVVFSPFLYILQQILYIFVVIATNVIAMVAMLFSFIVAIVLSAGFNTTCYSLDNLNIPFLRFNCSDVEFYSTLQAAVGLAWLQVIFVGLYFVFELVYQIISLKKMNLYNRLK